MVLRQTQQLRHSNYKVKLTGKGKEKMDVQVCGCADMQMKRRMCPEFSGCRFQMCR